MTYLGAAAEQAWRQEAAELGQGLCRERYAALWTQAQLATALGVGPSWVSRLEAGNVPEPSRRTWFERARAAVAARRAARQERREARARLWRTEAEMLGLVLRRQRRLAKWNQRRLASALGVAQPTIARLERGQDIAEPNGRRWYAEALTLTAALAGAAPE